MNRKLLFCIAVFVAVVGLAVLNGDKAAQAGHGCNGSHASCAGCAGCHAEGSCAGACHGRVVRPFRYRGCHGCNGCNGCHAVAAACEPVAVKEVVVVRRHPVRNLFNGSCCK